MNTSCPDSETLAAYLGGDRGEAIERHLAACPACLEALRVLAQTRDAPPLAEETLRRWSALAPARGRSWAWQTAAAALLLAVGGWALWGGRSPDPLDPLPDLPAFPDGPLKASALGPGVDLLLEPGARVEASEAGHLVQPLSGRFWLGAHGKGKAPVRLELPGFSGLLRQGRVAVELGSAPQAAWMMRAAWAQAVEGRLWVLEGSFEAGSRSFPAGTVLDLAAEDLGPRPMEASDRDRLLRSEVLVLSALPGKALFEPGLRLAGTRTSEAPDPAAGYRWATILSRRASATEVGLCFPAGGVWFEWVTGLGARSPREGEVLEVLWDGERALGRLDGVTVFSGSPAELDRLLRRASAGRWALSVWGGEATVARSVLGGGS